VLTRRAAASRTRGLDPPASEPHSAAGWGRLAPNMGLKSTRLWPFNLHASHRQNLLSNNNNTTGRRSQESGIQLRRFFGPDALSAAPFVYRGRALAVPLSFGGFEAGSVSCEP
jgi:hypothetical protein